MKCFRQLLSNESKISVESPVTAKQLPLNDKQTCCNIQRVLAGRSLLTELAAPMMSTCQGAKVLIRKAHTYLTISPMRSAVVVSFFGEMSDTLSGYSGDGRAMHTATSPERC